MSSEREVISVEDIKKEMMKIIRKEMSVIFKKDRGCGISPHIISNLSSILQEMNVLRINIIRSFS